MIMKESVKIPKVVIKRRPIQWTKENAHKDKQRSTKHFKQKTKERLGSVLRIFLVFLCFPIMCLYVLSSVLRSPIRFPLKNDIRFVFTSSCL